jgi:hypothetical protein
MDAPVSDDGTQRRLAAALARATALLAILDREHTAAELYTHLHGVRHEVETACRMLPARDGDKRRYRGRLTRDGRPHLVLKLLGHGNTTTRHAALQLGLKMTAVSCILSRFTQAGLVHKIGTVRPQEDGRSVTLWEITPKGQTALTRLATEQIAFIEL